VNKNDPGRFFEDFRSGQTLRHATPRTVTEADQALYIALTGARFALHSSDEFARGLGLPRAPLDDLLVFNMVFGRTVADISLNAVANLGYADCVFGAPVYPGDTLTARSHVLGLRETASGKTGVVWVRSTGTNQRGETVLDYVRWVMVNKRDPAAPAPEPVTPDLPETVAAARLIVPAGLSLAGYDAELAGSAQLYDDYQIGERIDHLDGMTLEHAEHQMATRLYQNNARVHFNQHAARDSRFGQRVVYGGHVISIARALSFNGLANAFRIAAINGGRHTSPTFAGDTIYAWSEVLEKIDLPDRADVGALRLRGIATKDKPCAEFPLVGPDGKTDPAVVLDLDYTVLIPRRG
jgi:2-methylfumaryl-CoA hydratase